MPNTNDDSPPPNPTLEDTRGELTRLEAEREHTEESRTPRYTEKDADELFNNLLKNLKRPSPKEKSIIRQYSSRSLLRLERALSDLGAGTKSKRVKKKLRKRPKVTKKRKGKISKKKKQGKKLRSVSNRTKTPFLKRVTKTIPKEVPTPTVNRRRFFPGMARGRVDFEGTSAPRKSPYVSRMMTTKGY